MRTQNQAEPMPARHRGAQLAGCVAASCLLAAVAVGCSSSKRAAPTSSTTGVTGQSATTSPNAATGPGGAVPPPASGIYLGLFDNAAGKSGTADQGMGTYSQLLSFEQQIHNMVAIDLHYTTWSTSLASESVKDDLTAGRIPLISWQCGGTDASVASGADDAMLAQQAKAVAALGKPIMIRWFWEMEFTGSNGGGQGARAAKCIGSGGPAGYVAAWRHIVDIFRANGATNVAWVFCPGQDAYSKTAASKGRAASSYYPGDSYVDWIAEDAYSRAKYVPMPQLVARMYDQYGHSGKPLMVCETGAEGSTQSEFLASFNSLPEQYPNLKAVVYFDSHGPLGTYVLGPQGITAFQQLLANPALAAKPRQA